MFSRSHAYTHSDVQLMCLALKHIHLLLMQNMKNTASYAYAHFYDFDFSTTGFFENCCIRLTIQHVIRIDTCCYIQGRIGWHKPNLSFFLQMQCNAFLHLHIKCLDSAFSTPSLPPVCRQSATRSS